MAEMRNTYTPDYVIHPGEYLEEILEARGIKKRDFAERAGLSVKSVSQIINRKALYSPDVALTFEKILDVNAELWMNMAESYQLFQARRKDEERLKNEYTRQWLRRFPTADLKRLGVLPATRRVEVLADSLLRFLGVSDPHTWEEYNLKRVVLYRKSSRFTESDESTAVWLHIATKEAEKIETVVFRKDAFRTVLDEIRTLTVLPAEHFLPRIRELCASAGVAFVTVPELKHTHISGAACWISQNKAMIAAILRYKTNDHFWFTFFHEAAHILLHGKKPIFLDAERGSAEGEQENEADSYACAFLIPTEEYMAFVGRGQFYPDHIRDFAGRIGIHPGIVVGRLQHDGLIPYSWHNDLKEKCCGDEAS